MELPGTHLLEEGSPLMSLSYEETVSKIRESLMDSVRRQLMSDVPYGVLLSGGLDSSVISAIAGRFSEKRIETGSTSPACTPLPSASRALPTCSRHVWLPNTSERCIMKSIIPFKKDLTHCAM